MTSSAAQLPQGEWALGGLPPLEHCELAWGALWQWLVHLRPVSVPPDPSPMTPQPWGGSQEALKPRSWWALSRRPRSTLFTSFSLESKSGSKAQCRSQERAVTEATDVQAGSCPLTLPPTTSITVFSCLIFQWKLFTCWDGLRKCSQKRKKFLPSDMKWQRESREREKKPAKRGGRSRTRQEAASLRQRQDQPFCCKFKVLSYFPKGNTEFFLTLVLFFFGCHNNLHSMKYRPHTRI